MTTTTLRRIRACSPCRPSWRRLCRAVGGEQAYGLDTPLPLTRVLNVLGLPDATWACRALDADDLPRVADFARRCALRVAHLGGTAAAATVADRVAAAADDAETAAEAARTATAADAARAAAKAAYAAAEAAEAAAAEAAVAAARAAAAADAAWHVERDAQAEIFREIFG
jgi:hypothetical protein